MTTSLHYNVLKTIRNSLILNCTVIIAYIYLKMVLYIKKRYNNYVIEWKLLLVKQQVAIDLQKICIEHSYLHSGTIATHKPWPIMLNFLPIVLLSNAQKIAYYAQYYAHN